MPYVITTITTIGFAPASDFGDVQPVHDVTRRAVATLDEVQGHLMREIARRMPEGNGYLDAWDEFKLAQLPDSGGTVGPLPDGTVIEVAPAHLGELNRATPEDRRDNPHRCDWHARTQRIVDAYNAAQEADDAA